MKQIFLLIFLTLIVSCERNRTNELINQIEELESLNTKLMDSINTLVVDDLTFHQLLLFQESDNNENKKHIKGVFFEHKELFNYDIYRIIKDYETNEAKKELLLKNHNRSEFSIPITLESKDDTIIDLMAIFDIDSISRRVQRIEMDARIVLDVE